MVEMNHGEKFEPNDGVDYLLNVDYFSGFFEVDKITSASQIINKLKPHFARYGIPMQLVSDKGPHFLSWEKFGEYQLWLMFIQSIIPVKI